MKSDHKEIHVLSLGAGVQSSALALMAARGEFEYMPDCAIFADTQSEPESVYHWLEWLQTQLPFPIHICTKGNLSEESMIVRVSEKGNKYVKGVIPAFTTDKRNKGGILARQCTFDYKIAPIRKKIKELYPKNKIVLWMGISLDEVMRMKDSKVKYIKNYYPLIEKGITRNGCLNWMNNMNYPKPPRSACVFCPFHSNTEWARLKNEEPDEFQRAVDFEKKYQEAVKDVFDAKPFLHNSRKPLDQIDFSSQKSVDLFNNECEGMCGI